jgi:hypothetical protein
MIGFIAKNALSRTLPAFHLTLPVIIAGRLAHGKIAVVADRPTALMSATRKQWLRLIRLKQREWSSTLSTERRLELTHDLECLRNATFTSQPPITDPLADISFATVAQFLQAPPICKTLYITGSVERHEQYMLATWMPPSGLVVIYDR